MKRKSPKRTLPDPIRKAIKSMEAELLSDKRPLKPNAAEENSELRFYTTRPRGADKP